MTTAAVYPGPLRLLAAATECARLTTGDLAVLTVLALVADELDGTCSPSIAMVAKGAHMAYRGTQIAIAALETGGWIIVERRLAPGTRATIPHLYTLRLPTPETPTIVPDAKVSWSFAMSGEEHAVWVRDHGCCRYCGSNGSPTFDHLTPRCQGGGNDRENLVVACRPCNSTKGNRTPVQAGMVLRALDVATKGQVTP